MGKKKYARNKSFKDGEIRLSLHEDEKNRIHPLKNSRSSENHKSMKSVNLHKIASQIVLTERSKKKVSLNNSPNPKEKNLGSFAEIKSIRVNVSANKESYSYLENYKAKARVDNSHVSLGKKAVN
jgi:hypothetical protein